MELVELMVFAPVGAVLDMLDRYPEHVERGRKQVKFAQNLGKMAMGGFGGARPASASKPRPRPAEPAATLSEEKSASDEPADVAEPAAVDAAGIDEWVAMSARDLIALVKDGSVPDSALNDLRAAEAAGRKRVTVIRAIDARTA